MNERILALATQAGFENGHQDRNGNSLSYELEKFAESIVGECAEVSKNYAGGSMPLSISLAIKQHFGVER